jgi:hypothetical protein
VHLHIVYRLPIPALAQSGARVSEAIIAARLSRE